MLVRRAPIVRVVCAVGFLLLLGCAATPSIVDADSTTTTTRLDDDVEVEETGDDFWDGSDPVPVTGPTVQAVVERDGPITLFVGDSILVSISDDLAARIDGTLVFDAANCRHLDQVVNGGCGGNPDLITSGVDTIAQALEAMAPAVPDTAVLVLANNSTITHDEVDKAMDLLADVPRVWWVNSRIDGFGRQDLNNVTLELLERRDPRARVIDWHRASADPDMFVDHVHLNEVGQRRLARLIRDHLVCDCVP